MEGGAVEVSVVGQPSLGRGKHIKKRALRNKALAVTFDEKGLKDYVTGFHKRKKKRRKEARQKQQEAERRKRIDKRKKVHPEVVLGKVEKLEESQLLEKKAEREFALYGGVLPADDQEPGGDNEEEEESELVPSVSGTMMYDNGEVEVTVVTSEISRYDEEEHPSRKSAPLAAPTLNGKAGEKHNIPPSKQKSFKKVAKKRSRPKLQKKRDKRKGIKNKKRKR